MKKIITLSMFFIAFSLFAQEETTEEKTEEKKSFSFSGSVDAYYRANLTAPNDENAIAPGSSFANLPGFALGMANLVASYEKGFFIIDSRRNLSGGHVFKNNKDYTTKSGYKLKFITTIDIYSIYEWNRSLLSM
jgi:hypothetical protein